MKLGLFHRSHAATAKKCTKKCDAHANLLFCLITLAVFTFLLPSPSLMLKLPNCLSGKTMGFHDGAWFHCTAYHKNFSHLAYYTRQIHNRTIFNTLINHNFCNSLSHQKCPLEREADQPCKQHEESVFKILQEPKFG